MCGIAGFIPLRRERADCDALRAAVERMTGAIRHRGPDDAGVWIDATSGVAIGHRRLSIIDLSARGRQPMVSASGRLVMSYNGEVYNFAELRDALDREKQIAWRSDTDTEVVLEAVEHWGLDAAIKKLNGMFALAVWDRQQEKLSIVRDRMGKKPLYYGFHRGAFLFGSEIKALEASPEFAGSIDRDSLAMLLRHNYIPSPASIYEGIRKLPPASIAEFSLAAMRSGGGVDEDGGNIRKYWDAGEVLMRGAAQPFQGTSSEALAHLDELLLDSVSRRMLSDVPLGAFLSGGIDSSLVVAAMQRVSRGPVKTFSIGYASREQDEALYAREVARHLGTEHTDIYVEPEEVLRTVPEVGMISDEPIGDTAMIPTYLLSKTTANHVTVALSGDGGDETFAGYRRYLHAEATWREASSRFGWVPERLRALLSGSLATLMDQQGGARFFNHLLLQGAQYTDMGRRLSDVQRLLRISSPERIHEDIVHWTRTSHVLKGGRGYSTVLSDAEQWLALDDNVQRLVYLDIESRLPDSILAKVDRATMKASLEARAPLLDYRMVELAATIPTSMKVVDGNGKWLLRELLYRYVPRSLVDRPKKGFSMPIADWLRGPLRSWAEDLLSETRLRREGFFNPAVIRRKWTDHLQGRSNNHYALWDVLMFQSWLDSRG